MMGRYGRWRWITGTRALMPPDADLELADLGPAKGLDLDFPMAQPREVHPRVAALAGRTQYEQRTPPWYEVRKCMLTASDAYAALDIPCYENFKGSTRRDLLRKKARAAQEVSFDWTGCRVCSSTPGR